MQPASKTRWTAAEWRRTAGEDGVKSVADFDFEDHNGKELNKEIFCCNKIDI
jgi:hypothetical protein